MPTNQGNKAIQGKTRKSQIQPKEANNIGKYIKKKKKKAEKAHVDRAQVGDRKRKGR
jgi:hypothetical protein